MSGDLIRQTIYLTNQVKRILDNKNKEYGLSGSQIRTLHCIYRANKAGIEINQKDVETNFGLQKSSISELLKSMEENGLIERVSSTKDSRYKAIVLTKKGEKYSNLSYDDMGIIESSATNGINEEELKATLNVINKMIVNLEGVKTL